MSRICPYTLHRIVDNITFNSFPFPIRLYIYLFSVANCIPSQLLPLLPLYPPPLRFLIHHVVLVPCFTSRLLPSFPKVASLFCFLLSLFHFYFLFFLVPYPGFCLVSYLVPFYSFSSSYSLSVAMPLYSSPSLLPVSFFSLLILFDDERL